MYRTPCSVLNIHMGIFWISNVTGVKGFSGAYSWGGGQSRGVKRFVVSVLNAPYSMCVCFYKKKYYCIICIFCITSGSRLQRSWIPGSPCRDRHTPLHIRPCTGQNWTISVVNCLVAAVAKFAGPTWYLYEMVRQNTLRTGLFSFILHLILWLL